MVKMRISLVITSTLLVLGACTSPEPSGDVSSGAGASDAVEVATVDNAFEPERLELAAGDPVEIEITNEDDGTHNFTIDELGLSTGAIDGGGVATARFVVLEGETTFACTLLPAWTA